MASTVNQLSQIDLKDATSSKLSHLRDDEIDQINEESGDAIDEYENEPKPPKLNLADS